VALGATTKSLLRALADKRLLPAKAGRGTAGATTLQTGAVEVAAPNALATMASVVETQLPQMVQEL
jgi:hypothetical protein